MRFFNNALVAVIATALFCLFSPARADIAPRPYAVFCGSAAEIKALVAGIATEAMSIGKGMTGSKADRPVALYIGKNKGWVLVVVPEPGLVCTIAAGDNWEVIEKPEPLNSVGPDGPMVEPQRGIEGTRPSFMYRIVD